MTSNEHHFVHDKYRNIAKLAEKTIFNLKGKTKIYCVDDFLVNFFLDEIDIEESEYHRNVIASEGAAIIQAKTAENNKTIDAFIKEQFSNSINKPEEITIGNRTYYSF